MADSILFDEEPVEKKKKGKRSKNRNEKSRLAFLISSEKSQFEKDIQSSGNNNQGIDLFAENTKISKRSNTQVISKTEKKLTSKDFANLNQIVKRYVFLTYPQNYSITKQQLIVQIDKSVQQTYLMMNNIFKTSIHAANKSIDEKRLKIKNKIDKISKNTQMDFHKKATKILYLDLAGELNDLKEKHVQRVSDDLIKCIDYTKLLHAEDPTVDIKTNTPLIENDLDDFPGDDPEANLILSHKQSLKKHFHKIKTSDVGISIHFALTSVCKVNNFETLFNYFPDEGQNLITFQQILEKLSNDFQRKIDTRIKQSIANPKYAGKLIVNTAQELCESKRLNLDKYLPYIFLYFTRHFFNQIYLTSLFQCVLPSKSREFAQRVQRLRNIPPIGFGFAQKYLVPSLISLRLKDFPRDHMYSDATALFSNSSYVVNPIDFCRIIFEAFQKIQIVASDFDFDTRKKLTGQLFAKSESLLCFDDLFDISLIVFLLAGVGDTFALTEAFSPFIYGMGLPSEFEFTFTNLHEICHQIAKMDIDKFMDDAMERTARDQEKDPLMIANYVDNSSQKD